MYKYDCCINAYQDPCEMHGRQNSAPVNKMKETEKRKYRRGKEKVEKMERKKEKQRAGEKRVEVRKQSYTAVALVYHARQQGSALVGRIREL